jgi:hypothetical protein
MQPAIEIRQPFSSSSLLGIPKIIASAAAGPAVPSRFKIGRNGEPASIRGLNKIHFNGLYPFIKVLFDHVGNTFLSKNLVIITWFIQNQTQRGPGSAAFVINHTDGGDVLLVFEGVLDHFGGFLCNVKHDLLQFEFDSPVIPEKNQGKITITHLFLSENGFSSPVDEKDPHADQGETNRQGEGEFLVKEKCAKEDAEDGSEEGERREPADRVSMNEFEPDEDGNKGVDNRLIQNGSDNIDIHSVNPARLENEADHEENRNREDKLIKEGIDWMDLFRHVPLDVEGCGPPEEGGHDLKDVSEKHCRPGGSWPSLKDEDDP